MDLFFHICCCFVIGVGVTDGARILGIFPIAAKSHFTCDNAIMKPLIEAGHEVTVMTSFPTDASKYNYTRIVDVSSYAYFHVGDQPMMEFIKMTPYDVMFEASAIERPICDKMFQLKEIQEILNSSEKLYDVVFVEMFILHKCFTWIAQKQGIPLIGTISSKLWFYADLAVDNPINPSYQPIHMVPSWQYDSLYHRVMNSWHYINMQYFWYFEAVPILRKFHQQNLQRIMPYSEFINKEPDFLFYNSHPVYYPRPMNPNVVEIGGIHLEPAKPLPKQIQKFIDEAEHGVILFALGSVLKPSSLAPNIIKAFKDALAELPQRVIWKFEDHLNDMPKNVLAMKWLPQRDILEHKNVIAFISHCGQGGTFEAIYTATPVIACPLYTDQPSNAALLEHLNVAVHLDIRSINKENVLNAVNTLINNTKYRENMQKLSKEFKDRPMTPQQSVVYWTEYIIRHNGAAHLKTAASRLNWFQYLLLDVLIFILASTAAVIYVIYRVIKTLRSSLHKIVPCDGINKRIKSE